jgi:guanylate cyclase
LLLDCVCREIELLLRGTADWLLSFGGRPGEPMGQRAKRRLWLAAGWVASLLTIPAVMADLTGGFFWVGVLNGFVVALWLPHLAALKWKPLWFPVWTQSYLGIIFVIQLVITVLKGGLLASGLQVIFGLIMVLVVLLLFGTTTAAWWFTAFVGSLVFAVGVPNWIDPLYPVEYSDANAAFAIFALGAVALAITLYFVRQRDRFQKESDDLLHNILPDEIAQRLKADDTMIADSFESSSVLFADVVDFTPMSATMSPTELVGLLNRIFTTFDQFVEELGLEKIKTVGDEYMVAAGVPNPRPDHAHAIAELALRIRDHVASNRYDGHEIRLRIGVNSGPVVAGIIGTHKFSYDLWGDAVNAASRMESEGLPGSIQVSAATYELIRDDFACEPRGVIEVKGKGEMNTYFLLDAKPKEA